MSQMVRGVVIGRQPTRNEHTAGDVPLLLREEDLEVFRVRLSTDDGAVISVHSRNIRINDRRHRVRRCLKWTPHVRVETVLPSSCESFWTS